MWNPRKAAVKHKAGSFGCVPFKVYIESLIVANRKKTAKMQTQIGVSNELQRSYRIQDFATPGVIMRERSFVRPQSHHNMHHNQVTMTIYSFYIINLLKIRSNVIRVLCSLQIKNIKKFNLCLYTKWHIKTKITITRFIVAHYNLIMILLNHMKWRNNFDLISGVCFYSLFYTYKELNIVNMSGITHPILKILSLLENYIQFDVYTMRSFYILTSCSRLFKDL